MYTPELLFVRHIDALKDMVANPSEERLFEASRQLRQLLFDQHPLVHLVNRTFRIKLAFVCVLPPAFPPDIVPSYQIVGIYPRKELPLRKRATLDLDSFFKHPIIQIGGQWATVKDVVNYFANYAGAVHRNRPDTPITQALEQTSLQLQIGQVPSALHCIGEIAKVALDGLEPLYAKAVSSG
jgi:hypothetical protein